MAASDRELLEGAARMLGMSVLPEPWPDRDGWFFCLHHGCPALHLRRLTTRRPETPWMPLDNDGDAFRLALDMGMAFDFADFTGENRFAEARRAIVTAAATGAK